MKSRRGCLFVAYMPAYAVASALGACALDDRSFPVEPDAAQAVPPADAAP
ncbi:MAG: hypothetical protein K0S65_4456, partial [Labilithrix sp.]|nr:hypothetical protein [Labilithrix sp.]